MKEKDIIAAALEYLFTLRSVALTVLVNYIVCSLPCVLQLW